MNANEFKKLRKRRINRQSKVDSMECLADSYDIGFKTGMNNIQAVFSAYVISGRGNLPVSNLIIK